MIKYLLLFAIVFSLISWTIIDRLENYGYPLRNSFSDNKHPARIISLTILEDSISLSKKHYEINLTAKITNISDSTITLFGIINSDANSRLEGYRNIGFNFSVKNISKNDKKMTIQHFHLK